MELIKLMGLGIDLIEFDSNHIFSDKQRATDN